MVALATAFVALAPQLNRAAFVTAGRGAGLAAGQGAGTSFGQGFQRNSQGIFKSMKGTLVGAANLLVPLALAGAVVKIAQIGMAYQDNLNIFQAVTKATGIQMDAVAAKARELGADFTLPGVSAAGAAESMTELAKAGFTVAQAMDAAKATLQLARIAGISEAEAATVTANAVNAFGIAAKDTTFVVDELAAAANSSSVDINDVDLAFRMASATFSGFQGPVVGSKEAITELNTAVAILGNNGIRGSDAGTSLKQMLLQLTGPTERAKVVMEELALRAGGATVSLEQQRDIIQGSKKVRDQALKDIKAGNKGLKDQGDIAYTSAGAMRSLPEVLDLVIRGTRGMTQEQKNASITQIFGADATRSIIALMKGGVPVYDRMRKLILQQGAAADFARAKNIGLKGSLDNVRSQLENIAIELFNQVKGPLTAAFTGLANALAPLPGRINSLASTLREHRETISAVAKALGVLVAAYVVYRTTLIATAIVERAIGTAQAVIAFLQLAAGVRSAAEAFALLDAAMAANPIGIVVVAIAALVAGLIYAYKHSETFRKIVDTVGRALRTAFLASIAYITGTIFPSLIRAYDQAKTATLFLYHNVILPVWHGIRDTIAVVVAIVRGIIGGFVATFNGIKTAVLAVASGVRSGINGIITAFNAVKTFLAPVINFAVLQFKIFRKEFEIVRLIVLIVVFGIIKAIKTDLLIALNLFQKGASAVFNYVRSVIDFWWAKIYHVFVLFRTYVIGPLVGGAKVFADTAARIFNYIGAVISSWYNAKVKPVFQFVVRQFKIMGQGFVIIYNNTIRPALETLKTAWGNVSSFFSSVYNTKIKPLFQRFVNFFKVDVVNGFKTAVAFVGRAWDSLREQAKKPIRFVVNSVINPFIGGLDAAAKAVGVPGKFLVPKIKLGFASGGQIPGMPSLVDNQIAMGPNGLLRVASGEFITNTKSTRANFPLINAINAKRGKVSRNDVDPYLDGYSRGGGVGDGFGDLWNSVKNKAKSVGNAIGSGWDIIVKGAKGLRDFIADPGKFLAKGVNLGLSQIPGAGLLKEVLKGSAHKMVDGAFSWIKGKFASSAAEGSLGAGKGEGFGWKWMRSVISRRFPGLNMISGFRPGARTLNGSLSYHALGRAVDYPPNRALALWIRSTYGKNTKELITPWNELNLHNGQPHRYSGAVWNQHNFAGGNAHDHWAMALGGLVSKLTGMPLGVFDKGGLWPSGTLGVNTSGHTEYVNPNGAAVQEVHFHFHSAVGDKRAAQKFVLDAYTELKRERKIP